MKLYRALPDQKERKRKKPNSDRLTLDQNRLGDRIKNHADPIVDRRTITTFSPIISDKSDIIKVEFFIFFTKMSLNLPEKLDSESEKNYQYFLSYCFLGGDRSIPKLSRELEGYGSSEKRLYQLANLYQWCDRATAFDESLRGFMNDVISEKVGGDVIVYHRSFENTFKIVHRLNLLMLSKISGLINDSDLKSQKGYILAIKGLAQIMASLSLSIKNNHESWGILLGIGEIKDRLDKAN